MMMYNTLKSFGEGRKKGCAINKILIYNQMHINDGCMWMNAHMYLQAIPLLGGSCTGKNQGDCKDEGICQWLTSIVSYSLEEYPHTKLHNTLWTRARKTTEGKITFTALLQDKTQCCDRSSSKLSLETSRHGNTALQMLYSSTGLTTLVLLLKPAFLTVISAHFWWSCSKKK